jgi:membrane associated rhomboid family serine protease
MQQTPLTNIQKQSTDRQYIMDALAITLLTLMVVWGAYFLQHFGYTHWHNAGLRPRTADGLLGIFSMPFLHGNWDHLWHNTLGFAVLNSFLFYFYRQISMSVFVWIYLAAGILLWVIGRSANHIGLSLIIYGEFSFLFWSGFIRKDPLMLRVGLLVTLYYGSLVWYLFPVDPHISWEGHLSGFLVGAVLAFAFRHKGPKRKLYKFELEPELPDDENAYWKIPDPNTNPPSEEEKPKEDHGFKIVYHYTERRPDGML